VGNGNGNNNDPDSGSHPSSLPGVIGGVVAVLVLLLVLLALLLYRYRRTRRVQAFLNKYTPFKATPYTETEKKRSSMGAGLLFTDGCHGDALMTETNRGTLGYGTMQPSPVAHPNPTVARPERADGPPQLVIAALPTRRPGSPTSPFEVSPLSSTFPQSPPRAVAPRRTSQDSLGGISIASSGVFSPSLLSWPAPPSGAPSVMTSPPASSHGNISDLAAKYKPMTPTPMTPITPTQPFPPRSPVSPSNWQKPSGWD
jgi:hypothetical protein